MRTRTLEISVGLFALAGILSFTLLVFKISGLSLWENSDETYRLYAEFDNAGSLSPRAKVSMAGVVIGRVVSISLEKDTYMAKVAMDIFKEIDNIPSDSTASITTAGILGEKYVNISIGGESDYLVNGAKFDDTQSAMMLEDLIGKFLFSGGSSGSNDSITNSTQTLLQNDT